MSSARILPYIQYREVSLLLSLGGCAIFRRIGCDAGDVS